MKRAARTDRPQRVARDPFATRHPDSACDNCRSLSAEGRRGSIQFFLQRVKGALYVEREEVPRHEVRITQSVAFSDKDSFLRWCNDDPIRFEHPLLHAQLKREGDELWRTDVGADSP